MNLPTVCVKLTRMGGWVLGLALWHYGLTHEMLIFLKIFFKGQRQYPDCHEKR